MLPKLNREGFKPPKIWLTASALGEYRGCERQLVMDAYFRHGGMYNNWHTLFGSAFGAAASAIAHVWDGSNRLECIRAAWAASLPFPVEAEVGSKNIETLWRAIFAWFDQWKLMYNEGWRYHSSEKLRLIQIGFADGNATTGGSSDLILQHSLSGTRKLLDFKAVGSNFFGAWEHDPQLIWYMLADAIETGHTNYAPPEYWTFVFKDAEAPPILDVFQVHPGSYTNAIVGNLALIQKLCVRAGLDRLVDPLPEHVAALWRTLPVNTHACKTGNFKCFRYSQCYECIPINWAEPRASYHDEAALPATLNVSDNWLIELCEALETSATGQAHPAAFDYVEFDDDDLFS